MGFRFFELFGFVWKIFLYFRCVLYSKLLFWMRLSYLVSFSVYMKIFQRYFLIFVFWKMFQKCEQFSYKLFFVIFCDLWGPKWSPPPLPTPNPGFNVKVPFRGKQIWKTYFFLVILWFLWKQLKNGTRMITSCSIRRVGPTI